MDLKLGQDSLLEQIKEIWDRELIIFEDENLFLSQKMKKYNEEVLSLLQNLNLDLNLDLKLNIQQILFYLLYDALVPTLEYLQKNTNWDVNIAMDESNHLTPLYYASLRGQIKCVKFLLDNGASVNSEPTHRPNMLVAAASNRHEEVVKLLLQNGATINKSSIDEIIFYPSIKQIILEHQELPS